MVLSCALYKAFGISSIIEGTCTLIYELYRIFYVSIIILYVKMTSNFDIH
jgi:hypothetical protein